MSGKPKSGSIKPPKKDSKVEKWRIWIEEKIKNEVLAMYHRRAVYQRVSDITSSRNPSLPQSVFFEFLGDTYTITQAAAIRRQAEHNSRVVSLGTLLHEIANDAQRLCRQRFVSMWQENTQSSGDKSFTDHFARDGGDQLDVETVTADLAKLKAETKVIVKYTDRIVAHADLKPIKSPATYKDLNSAIDTIGDLFEKYALLLTAASWHTLVPVIQNNWEAIFEVAWLIKGDHPNRDS